MLIANGESFFPRETAHVVDGRLTDTLCLVDVGGHDVGDMPDAREQIETSW
jgi:hypothetical protein